MFKVNNKDTITTSLTWNIFRFKSCSSVSIVNFEQVNVGWVVVVLGMHISWRDHIRTVESKAVKGIVLLNPARKVLTEVSLKTIYFSYNHSYLNYANIAWVSTSILKLNNIRFLQKRFIRIVFNAFNIFLD